jgi:uncharacterized small protein (DUF1192 family)
MREYRARHRGLPPPITLNISPRESATEEYTAPDLIDMVRQLGDRIADLANEVARLKRELAARPVDRYSTRPFTPVPKPSQHR